ncbi:unnamed protein product [Polarella glacialis]|uniref:Zinc-ribbon domain-containing protein n=1 Tax=Polarella glacialis TaxID=89957 RepID=A0A813D7K2_POLGL|nr:unnamed protein product [Polarella glacialis]CAE8660892.1 unnamed protein product [Polarella glacialis]CAE8669930.1 unnamed protein product [Polarella glacialis]
MRRIAAGRPKLGLEKAKGLAAQHGGTCLSESYTSVHHALLWQCAHGHEWQAPLASIKYRKRWCHTCLLGSSVKPGLDVAQGIAFTRGGFCLSSEYRSSYSPMRWRCQLGHEWEATLSNVKNGKTWCPRCAVNWPLNLEAAKQLAAGHGGQCTSAEYKNNWTPLSWRCLFGHHWQAPMFSIKIRGRWCPQCALTSRRGIQLQAAANLAALQGGQCLSMLYINNRIPLRWKCEKGHEWEATLNKVKNCGTWCPTCASWKSEREVRRIFETIFPGFFSPHGVHVSSAVAARVYRWSWMGTVRISA